MSLQLTEQPAVEPAPAKSGLAGQSWELYLAVVLALAVPLGYALYTNQIWEDWFITFRHSKNLCEGKGLVYQEGERVHGFTSPLGTLLPALCYWVTGMGSYEPALWLFRVLSCLAFAGGAWLLLKSIPRGEGFPFARVIVGIFYISDLKSVAFSTSGMETAFMLLFLAWGVYLFARGQTGHWLAAGLCWGALMWTRPDGFVYIGMLALANLFFAAAPRRQVLVALLKSGLVCTVVYLPWFAWAWNYYGTPVPHTVQAKKNYGHSELDNFLFHKPAERSYRELFVQKYETLLEDFEDRAGRVLQPIYYDTNDEWYPGLKRFTQVVGMFCALWWLLPVRDRMGRMASFCFFGLLLYLMFMLHVFPWYQPPVAFFGLLALGCGGMAAAEARGRAGWLLRWSFLAVGLAWSLIGAYRLLPFATELPTRLAVAFFGLLAAGCYAVSLAGARSPGSKWARGTAFALLLVVGLERSCCFALNVYQARIQQREIEFGVRQPVGLWLKDRVQPGETIYLEPIGYIGYFSEAKIHDWPGLVSVDVDRLVKEQGLGKFTVPQALKPNWMVLRPGEEWALKLGDNYLEKNYDRVAEFDVTDKIEAYGYLPTRSIVLMDARYSIWQRKKAGGDKTEK